MLTFAKDFALSERDAARIGWGDRRDNETIRATVAKLAPDELLRYLDNRHRYSKAALAREIRQRHPHFESDTESLSRALSCVAMERYRLPPAGAMLPLLDPTHNPFSPLYSRCDSLRGGILDWEDARTEAALASCDEMAGFGLDCRPEEPYLVHRRPEMPPGLLEC